MPGLPNIGFGEMVVIFAIALVVIGPRNLPDVARTLGRLAAQARRAADELRYGLEREVQIEDLKKTAREIEADVRSATELGAGRRLPPVRPAGEPAAGGEESEPQAEPPGPGSGTR
ncbi:Sec-independent protein translocase protein TatB [Myxococcota bacterium]|nr:Sec-independent protein translocase protein TatB [Myxococcota bacterium]